MLQSPAAESRNPGIDQVQNIGVKVVHLVCSIFSILPEMILRPFYGTRYFPTPVVFLSTMLMILMPAFSAVTEDVQQILPFTHYRAPIGLFGIGSLSKLYFILSFIHGIRLWRLMVHMEKETISTFEGPPLIFFQLLPKSSEFWLTRIIFEPAAVLIVATVLGRLFIFQPGLTHFLQIAALMLAMKQLIEWHRAWEYLRGLMDSVNLAPIIASLVENRATQEDLAQAHLASFPSNISPEMRRSAAEHFARVIVVDIPQKPRPER
jgi:hypothetical protein